MIDFSAVKEASNLTKEGGSCGYSDADFRRNNDTIWNSTDAAAVTRALDWILAPSRANCPAINDAIFNIANNRTGNATAERIHQRVMSFLMQNRRSDARTITLVREVVFYSSNRARLMPESNRIHCLQWLLRYHPSAPDTRYMINYFLGPTVSENDVVRQ